MSQANSSNAPAPVAAAPAESAPASPEVGKVAAAPEAAAPKAPTAAEIRKMRLKLDGADVELSEDEVIRLAQQSGSSQKRFSEASQLRKQAEQVLEFIQNNPKEALAKLGVDLRKFSEETLQEILQREAESPEQKKIRETEEKLRAYEKKEQDAEEAVRKKAAEDAENEQKRVATEKEQALMQTFDNLFVEALKISDLPRTPWSVHRMASLMRIGLKNGIRPNAEQLAKLVREDFDNTFQARVPRNEKNELDGEKILAFLGDDILKALNKAQVKKLKSASQKFSAPTQEPTETVAKGDGPSSWREFTRKSRTARS